MTRTILTALLCFFMANISSNKALAGVITVSRINTDDILIPMFDSSLGTLDRVDLTVTLRGGVTNQGGSHEHATYTLLSANTRSNRNVGNLPTFTSVTSTVGPTIYSVQTQNYSGGGLSIGQFNFAATSSNAHNHTVDIRYQGLQQVGSSAYRARVLVDTRNNSPSTASYDDQTKLLSFSGGDLSAFLGTSDLEIAAGILNTQTVGSHSHSLSSFSRTVGSSTGSWTWFFSPSSTPSGGSHYLTLDPRFDTVATFHYTPVPPAVVPEPSSLALLGMGTLGLLAVCRRRRMKANGNENSV